MDSSPSSGRLTGLGRPWIVVALATMIAIVGCRSPERPNLLIITVDTLRQDHLGCYGGELETPHLDALARAGYRFDSAFAPSPTTLPSHTSLFTGTYPARHRVRFNGRMRVPSEAETLAELLAGQGYRTAAFVGTSVLDAHFGLDQGFDLYDDALDPELGTVQVQRRAENVTRAAKAWLEPIDEPFFLWAHFFDPHGPYQPPAPWDTAYYEGDPRDPENDSMQGIDRVFYQDLEDITDRDWPLAQYKGEVSYTDAAIGDLLALLEERGLAANTLVVLTADHGESLGESDYWFDHGETLHDACLAVPLIVVDPRREGGRVIETAVSLVDLFPTIVDLVGLPVPEGLDGRSLMPSLDGLEQADRPIFFETYLPELAGRPPRAGVLSEGWKLVAMPGKEKLVRPGQDPTEEKNLVRSEEDVALELGGELGRYLATEGLPEIPIEPDPEQRQKLEALGYLR